MNKEDIRWSFITVNYGNTNVIRRLHESLQKISTPTNWEWIIVDNDSPKDDGTLLKKYFEEQNDHRVHVIIQSTNTGFGGGNNEGMRWVKGEYIGIINPDIEVKQDTFAYLEDTLKDHPNSIAVPQLFDKAGEYQDNTRYFPTLLKLAFRRFFKKDLAPWINEKNATTVVPWAQGSFLTMKKSLFHSLKGFDAQFFIFFEDVDLCRRAWEKHYSVILVKKAHAFHSTSRLSGNHILSSFYKKTFWLHISSAIKYFWKYRSKKIPTIK